MKPHNIVFPISFKIVSSINSSIFLTIPYKNTLIHFCIKVPQMFGLYLSTLVTLELYRKSVNLEVNYFCSNLQVFFSLFYFLAHSFYAFSATLDFFPFFFFCLVRWNGGNSRDKRKLTRENFILFGLHCIYLISQKHHDNNYQ